MIRPVGEFTDTALYLDTMVPYALLRGIDPAARVLFARLQACEFVAYTSVLTFDELSYRLLLALIRDQYGGSPLERLRQDEAAMIAMFYPRLAPQLARLRAFPNLFLVDLVASDLDVMDAMMSRYQLRPRDALHVAAMHRSGCFNLVSNDADFDRVLSIQRYMLAAAGA